MFISFFGPPGAGKGTHTHKIRNEYNVSLISMGDIIKKNVSEQTSQGKKFQAYIDQGLMIPTPLVFDLFQEQLPKNWLNNDPKQRQTFLLDGFPRSTEQALCMQKFLEEYNCPFHLIFLNVDQNTLLGSRIKKRMTCMHCGHTDTHEGICPTCHIPLQKRRDDEDAIFQKRMDLYRQEEPAMLNFYNQQKHFYTVDASKTLDNVYQEIKNILSKIGVLLN